MCDISFRKFGEQERPPAGELWVRPAAEEDRQARAVALVVFDKGLAALEQGPGPLARVVVDVEGIHPNFDEMLAALFAQRLLRQPPLPLPPAFRAFAVYARQLAQGLPPTRFPPEETMEGVFLAVRNLAGAGVASPDLADPAVAAQFLERWRPLADRLVRAAEAGADPFQRPLFRGGAEFAREKAFLRRDKSRYRRDVRGGERWTVQLPGMTRPGSGLLLRRPHSLLFPSWSRRDRHTPTGESYLFLAVDWGDGLWIFSTDPVQEDLTLKGLAEELQAAETEHAAAAGRPVRNWLHHLPRRAAAPPPAPGPEANAAPAWYDGRDYGNTLVSSPKLVGTSLPAARVLDVVKQWVRAKRYTPPKRPAAWPARLLAAACLLAVAVLAAVVFWPRPDLYVYDKTAPAVVLVKAGNEQGTGFLISDGGWLVTNYHVVRTGTPDPATGALQVTVILGRLVAGRMQAVPEPVPALLYKYDPVKDLALLKLTRKPAELPALPFLNVAAAGTSIQATEECWVVGNPVDGTKWQLRNGKVDEVASWPEDAPDMLVSKLTSNAKTRTELQDLMDRMKTKVILTECDLGKGDSGSPLVDRAGDVIGVSFAVPDVRGGGAPKFAFHVHLDELIDFLKDKDQLGPDPPPLLPDPRPRDSAYKLDRLDNGVSNGEVNAAVFWGRDDGKVAGLWLDLRHLKHVEPAPGRAREEAPTTPDRFALGKYQFALISDPFPAAFYADKDGVIGVIAEDPDDDGKAGVVLRRLGGAWAVSGDPADRGRPVLDPGWFADKELGDNFAKFRKYWGKEKITDVFTKELAGPPP